MAFVLKQYPKRRGASRFSAYYTPVDVLDGKTVEEPFIRGEIRGMRYRAYLRIRRNGKRPQWVLADNISISD